MQENFSYFVQNIQIFIKISIFGAKTRRTAPFSAKISLHKMRFRSHFFIDGLIFFVSLLKSGMMEDPHSGSIPPTARHIPQENESEHPHENEY